MGNAKSLAHTRWNCKYHIVFAPKYRRQVFYGEKKAAVGEILRRLCGWKGANILEAACCPDHIRMVLEILPKMSVSSFMGYLKGKSSLMLSSTLVNASSSTVTASSGAPATTWIRWARILRRQRNTLPANSKQTSREPGFPFPAPAARLRSTPLTRKKLAQDALQW